MFPSNMNNMNMNNMNMNNMNMNMNNLNGVGCMMFQNNFNYNNNNISNSMNINTERTNQNNINNINMNQNTNNSNNNSYFWNIDINDMPKSARFNCYNNLGNNFNNNPNNFNFNNDYNKNFNNNTFNNNNFNNNNFNNNNCNNNFNNNYNDENNEKINQMKELYNKFSSLEPYEFQKKIAKNPNNNNNLSDQLNDPFLSSSKEKECENPEEDTVNIVFIMMKGNKHLKNYKKNETIKNVLEKFIKDLDIHVNTLKEIYFLFNATNLNNVNPNKTIEDLYIRNFTRINVIDMKNIIGS